MQFNFTATSAPSHLFALGQTIAWAFIIFWLLVLVFAIIIWWRIFAKAGYSGAMGLLMFVPLINIIALIILAFADWPVQKELRRYTGGPTAKGIPNGVPNQPTQFVDYMSEPKPAQTPQAMQAKLDAISQATIEQQTPPTPPTPPQTPPAQPQ